MLDLLLAMAMDSVDNDSQDNVNAEQNKKLRALAKAIVDLQKRLEKVEGLVNV